MPTRDDAFALLRRQGQEHLFRFWDHLDETARRNLLLEIEGVDFELMARLQKQRLHPSDPGAAEENLEPIRGRAWEEFGLGERAAAANAGMRALREGKAAAFVVAGGQGTRLGHEGPKGTLDIGLPSGKSLFQLQAERMRRLSEMCGRPIPWYVMTSRDNHAATTAFFEAHGFFGLAASNVSFFSQDELPVLDADGKILLAEPGRISMGPNGNGGCFQALARGGGLEDMARRGVEWVFLYSVDNALVRVCDPRFLGFALNSGLPLASKAVPKTGPEERVGVFCRREGKPSVLEYSEIPPELRDARDSGGTLRFDAANLAVHLLRRDFIAAQAGASLPYHVAHKKIPCVGPDGVPISPDQPNAYKFEMFMFDLFARAPGMAVLKVDRAEEFAPVKNPPSARTDSPATARAMILDLHRKWAEEAGFSSAELTGLDVEISPLTSYAGEGLNRSLFRRDAARPVLWA